MKKFKKRDILKINLLLLNFTFVHIEGISICKKQGITIYMYPRTVTIRYKLNKEPYRVTTNYQLFYSPIYDK